MQDVDGSGDLSLSEVTEFLQQRGFVASAEEVEGTFTRICTRIPREDYLDKLRTAQILYNTE